MTIGKLARWQAGKLAGWQAGQAGRLGRLASWQAGTPPSLLSTLFTLFFQPGTKDHGDDGGDGGGDGGTPSTHPSPSTNTHRDEISRSDKSSLRHNTP